MNSAKSEIQKLSILGFCRKNTPIVAEIAYEALGISSFDIIKNVEVDTSETLNKWDDFTMREYHANNYDYSNNRQVFFGVLDAHIKYILYHYFLRKYSITQHQYVNLVHPSRYYSRSSKNKSGLLMEPLSVVSLLSEIGFGVSIKRGSTVGHHVKVEDFVSINPGVNISGNIQIGEGATIGTGSSIINNVSIGRRSLIGAGSVVTKDIPDGVIAYGNPCRVIRENTRWNKVKEFLDE